jgi:hypothetical protein
VSSKEVLNQEAHFPPVVVHHSKLSIEEAQGMSPEQLWEFHAKELVSQYSREMDRIKFLAVTNATRYGMGCRLGSTSWTAALFSFFLARWAEVNKKICTLAFQSLRPIK